MWICCSWRPTSLATLWAWITPGTDEHWCSPLTNTSTRMDTGCQTMTGVGFKPSMVSEDSTFHVMSHINVGLFNYGETFFCWNNQSRYAGRKPSWILQLHIWLLTVSSIQPPQLNWIQSILMWFIPLTDLNMSLRPKHYQKCILKLFMVTVFLANPSFRQPPTSAHTKT